MRKNVINLVPNDSFTVIHAGVKRTCRVIEVEEDLQERVYADGSPYEAVGVLVEHETGREEWLSLDSTDSVVLS